MKHKTRKQPKPKIAFIPGGAKKTSQTLRNYNGAYTSRR